MLKWLFDERDVYVAVCLYAVMVMWVTVLSVPIVCKGMKEPLRCLSVCNV